MVKLELPQTEQMPAEDLPVSVLVTSTPPLFVSAEEAGKKKSTYSTFSQQSIRNLMEEKKPPAAPLKTSGRLKSLRASMRGRLPKLVEEVADQYVFR